MTEFQTDAGDRRVQAALHGLAGGPVPDGLADKALAGATRQRRRLGVGVGLGAVVLAGALAVPYLRSSTGDTGPAANAGAAQVTSAAQVTRAAPVASATPGGVRLKPVAAVVPQGGECAALPDRPVRIKEVDRADWPDFVRTVVAALPSRPDYVMQSGYSWCAYPDSSANAYAVVDLGHTREHGHLTVNLYIRASGVPATCDRLRQVVSTWHVEFCDPATATSPMAYGLSYGGESMVGALYADGHAVVMESIGDGTNANPITAAQLRSAVTAAAVHDVIPEAAAPGR